MHHTLRSLGRMNIGRFPHTQGAQLIPSRWLVRWLDAPRECGPSADPYNDIARVVYLPDGNPHDWQPATARAQDVFNTAAPWRMADNHVNQTASLKHHYTWLQLKTDAWLIAHRWSMTTPNEPSWDNSPLGVALHWATAPHERSFQSSRPMRPCIKHRQECRAYHSSGATSDGVSTRRLQADPPAPLIRKQLNRNNHLNQSGHAGRSQGWQRGRSH